MFVKIMKSEQNPRVKEDYIIIIVINSVANG